jgi:hypothetical protein
MTKLKQIPSLEIIKALDDAAFKSSIASTGLHKRTTLDIFALRFRMIASAQYIAEQHNKLANHIKEAGLEHEYSNYKDEMLKDPANQKCLEHESNET